MEPIQIFAIFIVLLAGAGFYANRKHKLAAKLNTDSKSVKKQIKKNEGTFTKGSAFEDALEIATKIKTVAVF